MKKILAINSGSSSFKFKLFTFPDEKVISEGMADRVGLIPPVFQTESGIGCNPYRLHGRSRYARKHHRDDLRK